MPVASASPPAAAVPTQPQPPAQAITAPVDPLRKKCDDTRPSRSDRLKLAIVARVDAEIRVLKHAKTIRATCKLGTKKTGAVRVTTSGGGYRVAPELADDVTCSSLPAGLTKDDAYVILWRVRESGKAAPTGGILQAEDFEAEDRQCQQLDRAAGLDFEAANWEDTASIDRLTSKRAPAE
jgi:hypothetical protein